MDKTLKYICVERIELEARMPGLLEFDGNCLIVLKSLLLAKKPEEGCALLVGMRENSLSNNQKSIWRIKCIWPCKNVWTEEAHHLEKSFLEKKATIRDKISRNNRFLIDPKDHICAQKWARSQNLEILGSAHSHPHSKATPSETDRLLSPKGLMVIVDEKGEAKAWWLSNEKNSHPIQLGIKSQDKR